MIKPLELCCLDFLIDNLSAANVFSLLQFCNDYEIDKKLMEQCMEFLRTNTDQVLSDESFLTISHKFLTLLLEDDFLNVTESRLFKAVCLCFFLIYGPIGKSFAIKMRYLDWIASKLFDDTLKGPHFSNYNAGI